MLLRGDHPDLAIDRESCECVGVCYRIRHLVDILGDLDYREKNGYTRTCVEVRVRVCVRVHVHVCARCGTMT